MDDVRFEFTEDFHGFAVIEARHTVVIKELKLNSLNTDDVPFFDELTAIWVRGEDLDLVSMRDEGTLKITGACGDAIDLWWVSVTEDSYSHR